MCETKIEELEAASSDDVLNRLRSKRPDEPFANEPSHDRAVDLAAEIAAIDATLVGDFSSGDPLPSGAQVIRDYELLDKIGEGGMGAVYRANHTKLGKSVALKLMSADRMKDAEAVAQFKREMFAVGQLEHPNIVRAMDAGEADGVQYLVMELVEGGSLKQALASQSHSPTQIVDIFIAISDAMQFAHKSAIVHRDLKPSNVLIDSQGHPRVVDFGLALHESRQRIRVGEFAGTPHYMAPEQVRGESHRLDGRTDIWAIGMMLYEALSKQRPFRGENVNAIFDEILNREPKPLRQIDEEIPASLERICLKCLAKRMNDRYMTAMDLANDLRDWKTLHGSTQSGQVPTTSKATIQTPTADAGPLAPVIPKGLRSFDAHDAAFFLQLLPGPTDQFGQPESLRFWKTKIEEREVEETFRVGVIYGPSGCGKSSFVKAGLLPHLSDAVEPVYLEATPEGTEQSLLTLLRRRIPSLPSNVGLIDTMSLLRERGTVSATAKLVIVLDQFEQWLHAKGSEDRRELVEALRHCDGVHLQAILMVRDDFWMGLTRFMREVEVRLVDGQNSTAVDLFHVPHAISVLAKFGQAYGRLPEKEDDWTHENKQFLKRCVAGLVVEGAVVPVQLSLIAEMLKSKPWTPTTLREVGGTEGVGVEFLESTFSSRTAPLAHRRHAAAAQRVLQVLLPSGESTDIKGQKKSVDELLVVSEYAENRADFDELLRILDGDLRLITPLDVQEDGGEENASYQLTHDFLVPSLRSWLTQKQRETWRGRAQLRLEQRAAQWNPRRENRFLPSPWECVWIATLSARRWTDVERQMMSRAWWVHAARLGVGAVILCLIVAGLYASLPRDRPPIDTFLDSNVPYEQRFAAFEKLEWDDTLWQRVVQAIDRESDARIRELALSTLAEQALAGEIGQAADQKVTELAPRLVQFLHDADLSHTDNEAQLFQYYSRLVAPVDVIAFAEQVLAQPTSDELTRLLLYYFDSIDLVASPPSVVQRLVILMKEHANESLVATTTDVLGRVDPPGLLRILQASFNEDVKTSAVEGLVPYARKAGIQRVDAICDAVELRLGEIVDFDTNANAEIRWTFELEYLVQGIGEIWTLGSQRRSRGYATVVHLLENEQRLEDPEMLDTVIRSFGNLYEGHGDRTSDSDDPIQHVRRVLTESESFFTRIAAADVLGQLGDEKSLETLLSLAIDPEEILNLREAAIENSGRIASRPGASELSAGQVRNVTKLLLDPTIDQPQRLINASLGQLGILADSQDIDVAFPFLRDPDIAAFAVGSIQTSFVNHTRDADVIFDKFVDYVSQNTATVHEALPVPPDRLVFEFATMHDKTKVIAACRRIIPMLAGTIAGDASIEKRTTATKFLAVMLENMDAPKIDADDEMRQQEFVRWKKWWEEREDRLDLSNGGKLRLK